jgi:hypothetical protein
MAKMMAVLLVATLLAGCFEAQRAMGCNNTGIFGCKDQPSEVQTSDPGLRPAPSKGRSYPNANLPEQVPEVATGDSLQRHEYPWFEPLDECMAAGGTRTECFEKLPPDILAQFEAWEAERADVRRRQLQQRYQPENSLPLDTKPDDSDIED